MIPKIFHQTSQTYQLPMWQKTLSRRSRDLNPDFEYRFWDDNQNESFVKECFPLFLKDFCEIQIGVVKADVVRCLYLEKFGGIYFDTDYEFLKKIPEEYLSCDLLLPCNRSLGVSLGNAVMGAKPRIGFFEALVGEMFKSGLVNIKKRDVIKASGPGRISEYFKMFGVNYNALCPERPIFHPQTPKRFSGYIDLLQSDHAVGLHYCASSWR